MLGTQRSAVAFAALMALTSVACSRTVDYDAGDPALEPATRPIDAPPKIVADPPRKGGDGLLVAGPPFAGLPVPRAAERRSKSTAGGRRMIYEITGPYKDVVRFYQRHLKGAIAEEKRRGMLFKTATPEGQPAQVLLLKRAFERTLIHITIRSSYAAPPPASAPAPPPAPTPAAGKP
jgi:hypothetical protein